MSLARVLAIVGACLAALLSGCSGQSDGIVLGFSQAGMQGIWRTANTESIKEAAEKSGIQLHFTDAGSEQEEQIVAILQESESRQKSVAPRIWPFSP